MKILHTADLHLGSPLRAAAARDGADLLRAAADGVLSRIVDVAIEERVDALVLAGDIFDRDVQDVTLRARLTAQLARASRMGIQTAMIRGNHDALMDYDRFGPMGEGTHLLTRDHPSVPIKDATFHGLSFDKRHSDTSMLPDYPAPASGLNIGLMHTSLDGAAGHDPYAPSATADLLAHGYDYWALGHIHKRSQTVEAGTAIVMPGIPQGRHANEPGIGSVTIATLGDRPEIREVPVARVAFTRADIDVTGLDQAAILSAFQNTADGSDIFRLIRFGVSGSALSTATLSAFATEALEGTNAAVEAIRITNRQPARDDALLILAREATQTDSFRDEGRAVLASLSAALPPEIKDALPDDALDDLLAEALTEAAAALAPQ